MGQTLTGHDHVREGTGHCKSPVVDLIIKRDLIDVVAVADCTRHATRKVAAYDDVVNLRPLLEGCLKQRHPFRTVARSRERNPDIRLPRYYIIIQTSQ